VWIRDAAFCVYALLRLGFEDEATSFMNFLTQCATPDGSPKWTPAGHVRPSTDG